MVGRGISSTNDSDTTRKVTSIGGWCPANRARRRCDGYRVVSLRGVRHKAREPQAAGPDWAEIENDPATLEALANSITIRRMRERGEVPSNYTSTTICAHCGPVPIYPGMAERVLGCPWCFTRVKGLPVPKVSTKTQVQDLGPAMLKRDGCEGHKWSDYYPSEKVRVSKLIKSEV